MSRRKRHHWIQICVWPMTERQAKAAHEPEGESVSLTPENMQAAWVACAECSVDWTPESARTFCPGKQGTELPMPPGVN